MSFPSAAALVVVASVKNRVRRIVRQPRHLIFVAVGFAYVLSIGVTRSFSDAATGLWQISSASDPGRVPPWLAFAVLGYLALVWVFGTDATALTFTEAEVDFFFTAPVRRRTLVHYKLVRTLLASLATGAFFGFVLRRGVHPVFATVGFSIAVASLSLHRVCASMTRATFLEHGVSALRRRLFTLLVVGVLIGRTILSISQAAASAPAFKQDDPRAWLTAANAWSDAHEALLSWILFPVVAMVRVVRAATTTDFFSALPAALAVLALHYAWAISTDVAFEESAFESAQKVARRMNELRNGRLRAASSNRSPLSADGKRAAVGRDLLEEPHRRDADFPSPAHGLARRIRRRPELARVRRPRAPRLPWPARAVPRCVHDAHRAEFAAERPPARHRQHGGAPDLPHRLRRPRSRRAPCPLVTLASVEWVLLAIGAVFGIESGSPRLALLAIGCAFAMPAVTACVLVVRNLGAVWFPSWAGSSALGIRGIEAFGQRLLILIGTLVLVAFVLVPAGLVAAGVAFALRGWLGVGVAPLAGLAAAAVAFTEAYAGLSVLARAFDGFEVGGH